MDKKHIATCPIITAKDVENCDYCRKRFYAPCMLEALKEAKSTIENSGRLGRKLWDSLHTKLESTIAKAEGKSVHN